jgi:hypothetical protein
LFVLKESIINNDFQILQQAGFNFFLGHKLPASGKAFTRPKATNIQTLLQINFITIQFHKHRLGTGDTHYLNPTHNRFPAHKTLLDTGRTYRTACHMSTWLEQRVSLQIRADQAFIKRNNILPTWTISSPWLNLVTETKISDSFSTMSTVS